MTVESMTGRRAAARRGLWACLAGLAMVLAVLAAPAPASAAFGVSSFDGSVSNEDGSAASQAGAHPYSASTSIGFNFHLEGGFVPVPDADTKDIVVELPPGFIGNPLATPRCSEQEFSALLAGEGNRLIKTCPHSSQIGLVQLTTSFGLWNNPLYNLIPPPGYPAAFGFAVAGRPVRLLASVRTGGDYGVTVTVANISQALRVLGSSVTLWGTPADPVHDGQRCDGLVTASAVCNESPGLPSTNPNPSDSPRLPFLSNPTACTPPGVGLETRLSVDPWPEPGAFQHAGFFSHQPGEPSQQLGPTGCEAVPFTPSVAVRPTSNAADAPTGLSVDLRIPQDGLRNPEGIVQSDLKKAVLTLPAGMTVNPASATGLGACSPAQIELKGPNPATCPDSSKLGTVEIETPLLEKPLQGSIYLAEQGSNPFDSLLALYIAVADPATGVVVKLPGRVEADPGTGRLTASFDDNPQLPFEALRVNLFGGPRASLLTPPACGTYQTQATLTPWSGNAPVTLISSFQVSAGPGGGPCPNGGFDPKFSAGTTNPLGGSYSPFALRVSREDGDQSLKGISATLPAGLLGKLAGIPYCPDSVLAGISEAEGTAAAQVQSPSCPAASQVGTVTVGAGAGPDPFYLQTGKSYLAGPYKGAPLSLAIVTPALAGPFDLGNVMVRSALQVDPETAQITAVSDPLPTILHGIPLDLRDVRVEISREGFTLNPTSCAPMQVKGTISPSQGAAAAVADRFQVASCERLGFKPKLSLSLKGSTKRTGHPALKAVVTVPPGANIARAQVGLPGSEFLDQGNLDRVCTRPVLLAGNCPASSVYGKAKAWTPLLEKPLEGNVYLVGGYGYKLPALVADLDGQVRILLVGRIDTTRHHGIRSTFEVVPDAPVSRFVLEMKGGKKYGLLENSEGICRKAQRAAARFVAHNGKVAQLDPRVQASCGGGGHPPAGKAGK